MRISKCETSKNFALDIEIGTGITNIFSVYDGEMIQIENRKSLQELGELITAVLEGVQTTPRLAWSQE